MPTPVNVPAAAFSIDAPAGTEHTRLASEAKKLYHYIKGGDNDTPKYKKELNYD